MISDTHIGGNWFSSYETHELFSSFLKSLSEPTTTVHTLIILGDMLELWNFPYGQKPLSVVEILQHQNLWNTNVSHFVELLKQVENNNVIDKFSLVLRFLR